MWVLGLLTTITALVLGAVFGDQYDVFDRVDLPRIPLSTDEIGSAVVVTAVVAVLATLLSALAGGLLGHRYHHRVDRSAGLR